MVKLSHENYVKINFYKIHLLIDDYKSPCSIRVGENLLRNERTVRYLGVDLMASPYPDNCSLSYDLRAAAGNIKRRCSILKPMRRLGFSQHNIDIVINGYIGGKLRFYTPWLGADIYKPLVTLDPLIKAYNQVMRVKCQAICTTPISLLHAGSRMPLLTALIKQDCTKLVLSSIAANNQLGKEYLSWNGKGDGWSPLGCAWECLRSLVPETFTSIQDRVIIPIAQLEQLYKCNFCVLENRERALKLHHDNKLIRGHSDWDVWTDGSFSPGQMIGGTGIVINHKSHPHLITDGSQVPYVTSSYDVEVAAFTEGIELLTQLDPSNQEIELYSDSRGLLAQLEAITMHSRMVDSSISNIVQLLCGLINNGNQIFITWVPGHSGILGNEQADELARSNLSSSKSKQCKITDRVPRLANYNLFLKQHLGESLDEYLRQSVRASSQSTYPDREFFRGKVVSRENQNVILYPYKYEAFDAPLFRVRTGHTYCRDHLGRFKMVKDRSCRFCSHPEETVEHLALECSSFCQYPRVVQERDKYQSEVGNTQFNDGSWKFPVSVSRLLQSILV